MFLYNPYCSFTYFDHSLNFFQTFKNAKTLQAIFLSCLLVINDSNLLHQLLCHIHDYFQFFSDFIGVIFLPTLIAFKAWNILDYDDAVFIVHNVGCGALDSSRIFTKHTHIYFPFLLVFKSFSNFFVSG